MTLTDEHIMLVDKQTFDDLVAARVELFGPMPEDWDGKKFSVNERIVVVLDLYLAPDTILANSELVRTALLAAGCKETKTHEVS